MDHEQEFGIEKLETRLETICFYIAYVSTCYKRVWFVNIPYPCIKYYRICL